MTEVLSRDICTNIVIKIVFNFHNAAGWFVYDFSVQTSLEGATHSLLIGVATVRPLLPQHIMLPSGATRKLQMLYFYNCFSPSVTFLCTLVNETNPVKSKFDKK